jgi:hypothetical protein
MKCGFSRHFSRTTIETPVENPHFIFCYLPKSSFGDHKLLLSCKTSRRKLVLFFSILNIFDNRHVETCHLSPTNQG